jgi:hypothetical protein
MTQILVRLQLKKTLSWGSDEAGRCFGHRQRGHHREVQLQAPGGNLENWEGAASSNLLRAPKLTEAILNEAWMQQLWAFLAVTDNGMTVSR